MDNSIPDNRKKKLDSLFNAFSLIAEGTYVFLCDMRYDYSRWSKNAVDFFQMPSEYMYGAGAIHMERIHPEDRRSYEESINEIFEGRSGAHDMQYRAGRIGGAYVTCTCRGVVIRDEYDQPDYFAGIIRNHGLLGNVDSLTGLRNQYSFFEDLSGYIDRKERVCISMLGIGKFTEINEIYGYHFGNQVIQKFGRYLLSFVGSRGQVYRLDGVKFGVISNTSSAVDAKALYEKVRIHLRKGIPVMDKRPILELNCGMLLLEDFNVDDQTIYACLNFAYGESKVRRSGDLVEFFNNLNDENRQRIEKLHAIKASIKQNYNGFYLLYQPVVNATTEEIVGAEALLRWQNDEYGIVPPDHFIPILERDPQFPELGRWILTRALTDAKEILKKHSNFVINVNLSYTQLEKPDFVDTVLEILKETDYPGDHLCLEITERCRLLDMSLLKSVVVNLKAKGIHFALDDFVTGFASVDVVKYLPLDTIKIDRSFVINIEEDEKERTIVDHFTSIATAFDANVCVEGIENAVMRDILQKYKVHSFQGYYYSKPVELKQLEVLMDREEKHE